MSEKMDIMHLWNDAGASHNPKEHSSVGICSIGACERGLALIFGMDGYLMVTKITIKETEVGVLCQPLQYLIDEM